MQSSIPRNLYHDGIVFQQIRYDPGISSTGQGIRMGGLSCAKVEGHYQS